MSVQATDPKAFFASPSGLALAVDPDAVFGLLSRTYALPPHQAALVTRKQGDRVAYAAGTEITADETADLLLVRTSTLTVEMDGLVVTSLDDFRCSASVKLRVSLIPERSELTAFQRNVVGDARSVRLDALREHLTPGVVRALSAVAEGRGVEVLIDPGEGETFATEVADGLKGVAFGAGLRIEKPIDVSFDSPVYRQLRHARSEARRRREEYDARQRITHAVETAQRAHTKHLSELLDQLSSLADRSPEHGLADLLRTFPETERGELYAALVGADDARKVTRWIVAGSGRDLLFFTPDSLAAPAKTVHIPDTIGPVRSVQFHGGGGVGSRLFIGASRGLYELSVDGDGDIITYSTDSTKAVQGGVNGVAMAGDHVYATHSELGLLCWKHGTDAPACPVLADRTAPAKAVRCARFFNGRLYFSIDGDVLSIPADAPDRAPDVFVGSRALITALCATGDGVYAGNAEGEVLHWPDGRRDQPDVLHAGRQRSAESVTLLDVGGLRRLFYTDTSVAVLARVLGDTFTCRYEAAGQTLRRVEVAEDLIVATNEARDRLIFWRPCRPETPVAVVAVAPLTGHSIQDVALIPAT